MDFNKPGSNKRVCAFFIDSIIGQVFGGIILFVVAIDISWIVWAVVILFKDCFNGQSVGKYLVGTQIIDENNLPVKSSKTIIRNIFMVIPIFPIIEYIRMLRDKEEGKRIGDKVAKTKVNDLKPQIKDNTFLWISLALALVVVVIQLGIGAMLIKQHPELLK
ncbi:MAG: RDD family protein [Candidatus Omnitrophota bacterium]